MPVFFVFRFLGSLLYSLTSLLPPPASGLIPAGRLNLYYESQGTGAPVVLLHAGLQDSRMWEAQVLALVAHHRVITIDLPGHGRSRGQDTTLLVQDALRIVLDSLHVPQASFVGLSLGAACVQDFVLRYPQRVQKVVLVSSGIYGWEAHYPVDSLTKDLYYGMRTDLARHDTAAAAERFTQLWCDGPYRYPHDVKLSVRQYVYQTTLRTIRAQNGGPRLAQPPAFERLDQIARPVLLIHGAKDAPYILQANAVLGEKIKGARSMTFPGVAHMINLEAPLTFTKAVEDFLEN